jgi:hypothetical protein
MIRAKMVPILPLPITAGRLVPRDSGSEINQQFEPYRHGTIKERNLLMTGVRGLPKTPAC